MTVRCPICGKVFDRDKATAMPFCSERCRIIDLGRWLDERHSIPHAPHPLDDEPTGENGNGRAHSNGD